MLLGHLPLLPRLHSLGQEVTWLAQTHQPPAAYFAVRRRLQAFLNDARVARDPEARAYVLRELRYIDTLIAMDASARPPASRL